MDVLFLILVTIKQLSLNNKRNGTIKGYKLEYIHTMCIFWWDSQTESVMEPFLISYACIFRGDVKTSEKNKI